MIGEHLALVSYGDGWPKDTGRLRAWDRWADENPPESGVVRGAKVETAADRARRMQNTR